MPEVVFLPGFMQHADSWSPIAAAVGERYPVKLLDFQTWTFEERLEEIRVAGEGGVLVGYSMGGRLALHAAVRWPDAFAALATVGAAAGIDDPAARERRRAADEDLAEWIEAHTIEEVVDRWEQNPVFSHQSPQLVEAQRKGRLANDPANLARLLRSAGQGALEPIWTETETLDLPLLALAGEHDEAYVAAARKLTRMEGQAPLSLQIEGPGRPDGVTERWRRAVVVRGAGHAAHLERPEVVAAALVGWLELLD